PSEGPIPGFTHIILQKVVVSGIQWTDTSAANSKASTSKNGDQTPAKAPTDKLLVTLAVNAEDAQRTVFAAEHGTVWLAADPASAQLANTPVETKDGLLR